MPMTTWKEEKVGNETYLSRSLTFKDFAEAFAFLTYVAMIAEKHNHHPHIYNVYNRVDLRLTTHDADYTVTEKDLRLAAEIDKIV